MNRTGDSARERVLVLAPTGRDATMIRDRLAAAGLEAEVCPDLPGLLARMASGAGALIVAQEALTRAGAASLLEALEVQEPWSDIPLLLLTEASSKGRARALPVTGLFERANVTLLQRPLGLRLFLSAVRSAVRARRRQYQMRDLYLELERAVQLGDLFVSILGHDLRTPIAAIRLSAESVLRGTQDVQALRPAGRILKASDRMNRMIEQLLDFARIRQGRGIPLQTAETDLGEVCRQVVEELEDANAEAVVHVEETGDLSGVWDADRLGQLFSNLIGNAVQYGSRGEPITVLLDGTRPAVIRVRVRNAGEIPAEAIPAIFEPFKHAGSAPAARKTGLGLGLFIAKAIAVAHGGDLGVESANGLTTFEALLPRRA